MTFEVGKNKLFFPLTYEKCSNMDVVIELYAVEHESQNR